MYTSKFLYFVFTNLSTKQKIISIILILFQSLFVINAESDSRKYFASFVDAVIKNCAFTSVGTSIRYKPVQGTH